MGIAVGMKGIGRGERVRAKAAEVWTGVWA